LQEVAKLVGVPFNTFYHWTRQLREGGKEALEDQCKKSSEDCDRELDLVLEWLERNGIKKTTPGFKLAKTRLKPKRTALTLYFRYRARVRALKNK
jgi:transposase-like protein